MFYNIGYVGLFAIDAGRFQCLQRLTHVILTAIAHRTFPLVVSPTNREFRPASAGTEK